MTIKELIEHLKQYPSDMNVKVALHRRIGNLKEITEGVDIDTNIESVWLCGDRD